MDRRPREPRQLAGEYGSSEHWAESLNAGELARARLVDADAAAVGSGVAIDDAADADGAAGNVAFKPKCLGIPSSIREHSANAERPPQVPSEHGFTIQSKSFDWLTHNVQRKRAALPMKPLTSPARFAGTRNRARWLRIWTRPWAAGSGATASACQVLKCFVGKNVSQPGNDLAHVGLFKATGPLALATHQDSRSNGTM